MFPELSTEEITGVDLVRASLLLSLPNASLKTILPSAYSTLSPPRGHAIQLRLTAEDPTKAFGLSAGTIKSSDVSWPGGHGVRIDTWLSAAPQPEASSGTSWEIGTDFDSLLAKVIVRGETFQEATQKGLRAIREVQLGKGIKTNVQLLAGVMIHPDWKAGKVDTLWLERFIDAVLDLGREASIRKTTGPPIKAQASASDSASSAAGGSVLIQPGTTFNLSLTPSDSSSATEKHTLTIASVAHNAFPDELSGTLQTSLSSSPFAFHLTRSTSVLGSAAAAFESPNPRDPGHIACPLTGKIVELHPALLGKGDGWVKQGDGWVKQGETLVVISVMKMETVVSAPVSGKVERLGRGVEEGVIMAEGMLLCVFKTDVGEIARSHL